MYVTEDVVDGLSKTDIECGVSTQLPPGVETRSNPKLVLLKFVEFLYIVQYIVLEADVPIYAPPPATVIKIFEVVALGVIEILKPVVTKLLDVVPTPEVPI